MLRHYMFFVRRNELENAAIFIEHGADVNAIDEEFHSTPLGYAAKYGRKEMVELLLSKGADVNLPKDIEWARPVSLAERRNHKEVAALLRL